MATSGDADSIGERESVPAGFSLLQLDDLELAFGSRRLSEELGLTASAILITIVAPGQVIALDRPEHERSVLLAYRGEVDIPEPANAPGITGASPLDVPTSWHCRRT